MPCLDTMARERTDPRRERRQQAYSTAFRLESRQLLRQSAVRVPSSLLAKDVPGFVAETAGGYRATRAGPK